MKWVVEGQGVSWDGGRQIGMVIQAVGDYPLVRRADGVTKSIYVGDLAPSGWMEEAVEDIPT